MHSEEKYFKKLLVEGNDDQHVIWSLCKKFKIEENFDVIDCEGIESLFDELKVRLKQQGINTIGIIIDADIDLESRWANVSYILSKNGFHCPAKFPQDGLVFSNNEIKIGIWIMPDNNLNGMLEDFISFLIPAKNELLKVANETLNTIEQKQINQYQTTHKSKALIHTWLSWQQDPGTPLGLAITKQYLNTEDHKCQLLIDWLNNTFGN